MKKSKQVYFDKYFERNWNNIKNTWKGIKSLVFLKAVASTVPTLFTLENGDNITNRYDNANIFKITLPLKLKLQKNIYIYIHINNFQTIFQMKLVVQYSFNLLIKKK